MPDNEQYDERTDWEKEDVLRPMNPRLETTPPPVSMSKPQDIPSSQGGTQADVVLLGHMGNNQHPAVEKKGYDILLTDNQPRVNDDDIDGKRDQEDRDGRAELSADLGKLCMNTEQDVAMPDAQPAGRMERDLIRDEVNEVAVSEKITKSPNRNDSLVALDHGPPDPITTPPPQQASIISSDHDASENVQRQMDIDPRHLHSYPSPQYPDSPASRHLSHASPFPVFNPDPLSPKSTLSPTISQHIRPNQILRPIEEGALLPSRHSSVRHQRLPSIADLVTTSNAFKTENRRRGQSMSSIPSTPWSPTPTTLGSPFDHASSPRFMQPSPSVLGPESPYSTSYPRRMSQTTAPSPRSAVPQSASTAYSTTSTISNAQTPASSVTEAFSPREPFEYSTPPEYPLDNGSLPFPRHDSAYSSEVLSPPFLAGQYPLSIPPELRHRFPPPRISTDFVGTYHVPASLNGVYKCDYPGCTAQTFQTQYLLNSHATVHSESRPHYCPIPSCPRSKAGKGFKRKNEMIRHGLVHEPPKFVCPFCPDDREHRYPRPDNLQRHIKAHHKEIDKDDPKLKEVLSQKIGTTTLITSSGTSPAKMRRKRVNSDVVPASYLEAARAGSSDLRAVEPMG